MKPKIVKVFSENNDYQFLETLRRNRTKRHRAGEFFVEGVRSINLAIENNWQIRSFSYSKEKRLSNWASKLISESRAEHHYEMPLRLLNKLSQKDEGSELIATIKIPDDHLSRIPKRRNPLIVVLDRIIRPGNLGTIIRSCDALGVDGIVVTGHSADVYAPETIRATTGSFFSVPVVRLSSPSQLINWTGEIKSIYTRLKIVGTSASAEKMVFNYDFSNPIILLIGNETHGLRQNFRAIADVMVSIPMQGSATSMNVACAASIVLYEIAHQRENNGV